MPIIGSVKVSPPRPKPGQSCRIEICGPDNLPLRPGAEATINGVLGSASYLQFSKAGTWRVNVTATGRLRRTDPGLTTESKVVTVEVAGTPVMFRPDPSPLAPAQIAMLRARQSFGRPYE